MAALSTRESTLATRQGSLSTTFRGMKLKTAWRKAAKKNQKPNKRRLQQFYEDFASAANGLATIDVSGNTRSAGPSSASVDSGNSSSSTATSVRSSCSRPNSGIDNTGSHFQSSFTNMSLDRSMQRGVRPWDQHEYSQNWDRLWERQAYQPANRYRWQSQNYQQSWFAQDNPGSSSWGPDTNDWTEDTFDGYQFAESERGVPKSHWKPRQSNVRNIQPNKHVINPAKRDRQNTNNLWQNLTTQFGHEHFHREGVDSTNGELRNSDSSVNTAQADSSGVDDLSSSGGGRKRPRSLDRGRQLSKSSRFENGRMKTFGSGSVNNIRIVSFSKTNSRKVQKPDSSNKEGNSASEQSQKGAVTMVKSPRPNGKKKQKALKNKAGGAAKAGEGVLERAERLCRELREEREQAALSRTVTNAQKVSALRSSLHTSVRQFSSAHKSFLRDQKSDSGSATHSAAADVHSDSVSANVSSLSSAEPQQVAVRSSVTSINGPDLVAASSSSSQVNDIDRIRRSIESSVVAEGKVSTATNKGRSLPGSRSPAVSVSSSVINTTGTDIRRISDSIRSPPTLQKDALAKLVNAPGTRTQRLQLARILRQHSVATSARPRRINLDGLYDGDDDGDSIGDMLKNISGLEEIDCAELKRIKLEDLTNEDKQRIAQLIEDIDTADKNPNSTTSELRDEIRAQSSHQHRNSRMLSSETNKRTEQSDVCDNPRSLQRPRAASPSPSRPLSLDDLNTEERSVPKASERIPAHVSRSSATRCPLPKSRPVLPQSEASNKIAPPMSRPGVMHSASPKSVSVPSQSSDRSFPARSPSPGSAAQHSVSPALRRGSPSSRIDLNNAAVNDDNVDMMDTTVPQTMDRTECGGTLQNGPLAVSEEARPASHRVSAGGHHSSGEADTLREMMHLCQRQDVVMAEMREIDDELLQMYKSIIEIVARMSGIQKRRKELQSEGEQLSQQRNQLLAGLVHNAEVSQDSGAVSTTEPRQRHDFITVARTGSLDSNPVSEDERQTRQSMGGRNEGPSRHPPVGASVILPRWLSGSPSKQSEAVNSGLSQRRAVSTARSVDQTSDVCLSGSVTSSVGSNTPQAMSQNTSLDNSVDNVQDLGLGQSTQSSSTINSTTGAASRASRVMLSINGVGEPKDNREATVASMSVEASQSVRSSVGPDNSSGIGSSISGGSRLNVSATVADNQNLSDIPATGISQEVPQTVSSQLSGSSRLVDHPMASPQPAKTGGSQNPNSKVPSSPGISVAYLGALSPDLVQQIVRNLPRTSQLGEVNRPSMYVLKPSDTVPVAEGSSDSQPQASRQRSLSVEGSPTRSRFRTSSLHSISSDSMCEQTLTASIPPLKLNEGSEKEGSKTCTPRSESDAHSVTSGTSLGEQIKLFSERNSSSQGTASNLSSLSYVGANMEDTEDKTGTRQDMMKCSVVLEKLDMENLTVPTETRRMEDDEADRPKKRKSRKDRDQSLQRRLRYVIESSSEGEEEGIELSEDGLSKSLNRTLQHESSTLPGDEELMEVNRSGEEDQDLDSTLDGSGELLSQDGQSEGEEAISSLAPSSTQPGVSPSRLKLNPENLKAFRANVRRTLNSPGVPDSSTDNTVGMDTADSIKIKKEYLKISGTCTPIMGICVHGNLLYVGFQGTGVNSYTLKGKPVADYPVATAQCFTMTPVGSGSQHYLAVGCEDHLTFLSINDQSVIKNLDTVVKVMCVVVVDTTLYAGLDSGAVVVISLSTLKETHHFQASDCSIHCMTWTREGNTRLLVISSQDAHIHVVDAGSGLPVRIISGHSKTAFSLLMLDHFVLSASGDRKVMAHNVHTAGFAWELNDHKGIVTSVCVDNGLLFTAGYDKIVRCYDLKTRKLLHLMYGAGKCIVMKMAVHNSVLYTGNREGEVEAVDLRDMGSFACGCVSCCAVYGLKEHLWHHVVADHLLPNTQAMQCPWSDCAVMLNTRSGTMKAGEHMRRHIDG